MKTAPHVIVGLTTLAALSACIVLAAEDRALFEPQQARLVLAGDTQLDATPVGAAAQGREAFPAARSASTGVEALRR